MEGEEMSSMDPSAILEGANSASSSPNQRQPAASATEPETNHQPPSTMPPELYHATKQGNVSYLDRITEPLTSVLTPQENTVLHLAAMFGQSEFACAAIDKDPGLLRQHNSNGDTPLHIAARYGNLRLVKLLIRHYRVEQQEDPDLESSASSSVGSQVNSQGDTPLHEAIRNKKSPAALRLLRWDPWLSMATNNVEESPLYLAADLGLVRVARWILRTVKRQGWPYCLQGPNGRTPLHAAALRGRIGTIRLLLQLLPEITAKTDVFGRTALHYSVSFPSVKITTMLLEADRCLAYYRDKDGLTPLLVAAPLEYRKMVNLILKYCPDCGELADLNGQNVYHLVMRDKRLSRLILNHSELRGLLNDTYIHGNTPLHLAVQSGHVTGMRYLLRRKGINLRARNNDGLTALDIAENTWRSIGLVNPHVRRLITAGIVRGGKKLGRSPITQAVPLDELKQVANTLLIVTTLFITISFTAAFTLPGGYSSDPSDAGLAVLVKKAAFKAFLICDFVAVCTSSTSAYMLVRGLLNTDYLRSALSLGMPMLGLAFYAMMIALSCGIYLVIEKKSKWLAAAAVLMGCSTPLWINFIYLIPERITIKSRNNTTSSGEQQTLQVQDI